MQQHPSIRRDAFPALARRLAGRSGRGKPSVDHGLASRYTFGSAISRDPPLGATIPRLSSRAHPLDERPRFPRDVMRPHLSPITSPPCGRDYFRSSSRGPSDAQTFVLGPRASPASRFSSGADLPAPPSPSHLAIDLSCAGGICAFFMSDLRYASGVRGVPQRKECRPHLAADSPRPSTVARLPRLLLKGVFHIVSRDQVKHLLWKRDRTAGRDWDLDGGQKCAYSASA